MGLNPKGLKPLPMDPTKVTKSPYNVTNVVGGDIQLGSVHPQETKTGGL